MAAARALTVLLIADIADWIFLIAMIHVHISWDKCFTSAIINTVVLTIVVLVMVLYSSVKKNEHQGGLISLIYYFSRAVFNWVSN